MAKPKLALIPSGVADDKVFSVLPSNGDGDFDFTRGSAATRVNAQGLIETVSNNLPRLNYPLLDGVVQECPSLLLEPQRTNLITYSEDFTQWSYKTGISVTSNEIISVDGALNGSKIETTANGSRYVGNNYTLSTGDNTFSVFAKKGVNNWVYLNVVKDGTNNWNYTFDLENGSLGQSNSSAYTVTPKIEDYGNGWYRCSITANVTSAGVFRARIYSADSATDVSTLIGANIYIFGAQLEVGSYATSYIPTNGQANGVTRLAETCNGAGTSDTFNDSEGVFMAELLWTETSSNIYISIDDNTSNNRILIYSNSTDDIKALVGSGGVTQAAFTATNQDPTTFNKVAVKYKQNDFALWINGIKLLTDTLGSTPTGLSNLGFRAGGGTNPLHGSTKQIQYFDTALTDSELEQLTSWVSFQEMANGQLYTIE